MTPTRKQLELELESIRIELDGIESAFAGAKTNTQVQRYSVTKECCDLGLGFCEKARKILSRHPVPKEAQEGARELTGLDELKGLKDLLAYFQGSNCGTMYDRQDFAWVPRNLLVKKIQGIISQPIPVSTPEAVKAKANADWPLRERIGAYIDELKEVGTYAGQAADVVDDLTKILEETGHTVYPPMRGTVKEESLAELADRKGFRVAIEKAGQWDIDLYGMYPGLVHKCVVGATYAEAEAKARQYLLGLEDGKGGERK